MNNPDNLLYAESHEWLKIEGSEGVIGITDFAQDSLGDITFIDLPQVGGAFAKGQPWSPSKPQAIFICPAIAKSLLSTKACLTILKK